MRRLRARNSLLILTLACLPWCGAAVQSCPRALHRQAEAPQSNAGHDDDPEEWMNALIRYRDETVKEQVIYLHEQRKSYQRLHGARRRELAVNGTVASKLLVTNTSLQPVLWPRINDWDEDYEEDGPHFRTVQIRQTYRQTKFIPPGTLAVRLRRRHLQAIGAHRQVLSVEVDHRRYLLQATTSTSGEEVQTWGLSAIQADLDDIPTSSATEPCGADAIKVCIVDSGLFVSHPDIPYDEADGNVIGEEFGLPPGQYWNNPVDIHGTFVAGIIGAAGGNGIGVVGVNPTTDGICLLVARAFADDSEAGSLQSNVNNAMEWWYVRHGIGTSLLQNDRLTFIFFCPC
jgi:Subtilase family